MRPRRCPAHAAPLLRFQPVACMHAVLYLEARLFLTFLERELVKKVKIAKAAHSATSTLSVRRHPLVSRLTTRLCLHDDSPQKQNTCLIPALE